MVAKPANQSYTPSMSAITDLALESVHLFLDSRLFLGLCDGQVAYPGAGQ